MSDVWRTHSSRQHIHPTACWPNATKSNHPSSLRSVGRPPTSYHHYLPCTFCSFACRHTAGTSRILPEWFVEHIIYGGLSSGARLEPLRELHCSASRHVVCRVLLVADKVAVAFAFPKLHCAAGRGQQRALSSLSSRLDGAPKLQSSRSGVMDWCYYARHPASRQTTWRKWCEQ